MGCFALSSSSAVLLCTEWQPRQLTLPSPWAERSKLACFAWWQLRQVSSTCLADASAGLKIFVLSPPLSTCALPAPWQFSQVTPALPCSRVILAWGLVAKPFDTSSWQVAQVSAPTMFACAVSLADCAAGFAPSAGAASSGTLKMAAPSSNIQDPRSSGLLP